MDRFVVRDGNPASSTAGSRRRLTSEESTTGSRSTSSTLQLPTAKRSKPRSGLSGLNLHKESRSTARSLAKISVVGSGLSPSLLVNRNGLANAEPVPRRHQIRGVKNGGTGAAGRVSSTDDPLNRKKKERPILRPVRSAQTMSRSDRVTDFFPRIDRGLNPSSCGRGRPLGLSTWNGRYPPPSPDGEESDDDSSHGRYRRHRSDVRMPEGDGCRRTDDHNNGERYAGDSRVQSGGGRISDVTESSSLLSDKFLKHGVPMHPRAGHGLDATPGFTAAPAIAPTAAAEQIQRSEAAERAAAAAERRAATGGQVERSAEIIAVASSLPSSEIADGSGVLDTPSSAANDVASPDQLAAAAETVEALGISEAIEVARENPESPSPCLRQGGISSLLLTQRRATGGRVGGAGGGVGDAGRDAFRRRALSAMFRKSLNTMRLRMGRVAGSRVGAGVVRGTPEGKDGARRITGGVSCLAFDSMGALLAVGGAGNVTVYDFDEYVPQIPRVKATLQNGVRAYLQPTHCIQTRRAVSCLRWNPANEDQLAVSFLHYDEIDVFDLRTVLPGKDAMPVLSLVPGSTAPTAASGGSGRGRSGPFRENSVGGVSTATGRSTGGNRGLGHLSLEFVLRRENGRDVTHLIAVGRGGAFRVWRLAPRTARLLAPYLQVQLGANPRARDPFAGCQPRPDVTAVCCLGVDMALLGTDSGTLATYSLRPPEVRAFQTGKVADRLKQWSLGDKRVWRNFMPDGNRGSGIGIAGEGVAPAEAFRIASLQPSSTHGPGVVVCGLRSGRVVVFDTRSGRALGITRAGVTPMNTVGYCDAGPYGGNWSKAVLACSKSAGGDEELLLLATSGRAALDRRRRDGGGRDSRLRPGPGWALGEAGGGGFRMQQCPEYGLCLPLDVEQATPGERGVVLSRDARAYLCSREQVGLLRSGMVTCSVMVGGEEHSVEAVSGDGRELLLGREYGGPHVRAGHESSGLIDFNHGSEVDGPGVGDTQGGETSVRQRPTPPGARTENGTPDPERVTSAPMPRYVEPRRQVDSTVEGSDVSKGVSSSSDRVPTAGSRPTPGDPWRPSGVRIFAKLKAVFPGGSGDENLSVSSSHYRWDNASSTGFSAEEIELDEDKSAELNPDDEPAPPWSLLQVVGKADLGLPATAITNHPRMNFVLVGLSDGTVVALLPGGKRAKRRPRTDA